MTTCGLKYPSMYGFNTLMSTEHGETIVTLLPLYIQFDVLSLKIKLINKIIPEHICNQLNIKNGEKNTLKGCFHTLFIHNYPYLMFTIMIKTMTSTSKKLQGMDYPVKSTPKLDDDIEITIRNEIPGQNNTTNELLRLLLFFC